MPKVLRIINRLNLGGPSYNAAYLTKFLEPEFETLLISGMKDKTEESSEFIVRSMNLNPVYIPDMHRELHPFRDYRAYYRIKKIIEEFRPDVVHTHAAKAGAVGRLAAIHSGVPVIVHTFHGHVFHSYFNAVKTRAFLEIERYLAKRTTKIIALSTSQKHELCNIYRIAESGKFEIIPLGFELKKFATDKPQKRKKFRTEYNIADDEIAIGIVGRLVPIKNHSMFLKALKIVLEKSKKKIKAFIIGDGEERDSIVHQAEKLGLYDSQSKNSIVTFTSWVKDIDVSNAGMDIIALTSNNEGTPVSLIEAQASGKAIVCTQIGGVEDIVLRGRTALLSSVNDENSFADNLLKVTDNETLRNNLAENGYEHVCSKFSYLRLCTDMKKLYSSLLQ